MDICYLLVWYQNKNKNTVVGSVTLYTGAVVVGQDRDAGSVCTHHACPLSRAKRWEARQTNPISARETEPKPSTHLQCLPPPKEKNTIYAELPLSSHSR